MQVKFIEFQSKKIHTTLQGAGNTIVFLHGYTETIEIWDEFVSYLANSFQVVCIDLPGHGKSDITSPIQTMDSMAEVVFAALTEFNIKDCLLVGHSMGGYVSLAFAEKYQQMLRGMVLFHSQATEDSDEVKINRTRTIEILKTNHHQFLNNFIPDLFAENSRNIFKEEIKKLQMRADALSSEGLIAAMAGMRDRPSRLDVLLNAHYPLLFIAGKQDTRIPIDKVMAQSMLPRHSETLILGDVGHMGYIEAKPITLITIEKFAEKIFNPIN